MVIRFIRGAREAMNKNKRKFDGVGEQESHGGHWDRGRHHGHQNSETENGARIGGGLGRDIDGNNGRGVGAQRVNGSNTNPPLPRRTENSGRQT